MMRTWRAHDPWMGFFAVLATLAGLFFIFDAGFAGEIHRTGGAIPREFRAQLIYCLAAAGAWMIGSSISSRTWHLWSRILFLVSMVGLVLVKLIGQEQNGAQRWIDLGPVSVQPAEFAKVACIVFLAGELWNRTPWTALCSKLAAVQAPRWEYAYFKAKRCLPALCVLLAVVLIEQEPDLGTAAVIAASSFGLFYLAGVHWKTLAVGATVAALGTFVMVNSEAYRVDRIHNHYQRWSAANVDDIGYQTVQSEIALADGGLTGVGIGAGRAKHVMPAATTDFILATVGEEFGLLGSLFVIGIIAALALRLLQLSMRAEHRFASLVLAGSSLWVAIQGGVNILMANGLLPAIGIPIPFISSGGSSLVSLWLMLGICNSVLAPVKQAKEEKVAARSNGWRNRRPHLSRA